MGSLSSFDDSSVTLDVTAADRQASDYLATNPPTFSTASAIVGFEGVTDSNDDSAVGFDDVVSTDVVVVLGKLTRPKHGCSGSPSLSIRRVEVVREPDSSDSSD